MILVKINYNGVSERVKLLTTLDISVNMGLHLRHPVTVKQLANAHKGSSAPMHLLPLKAAPRAHMD